jgi:hypothetical protein
LKKLYVLVENNIKDLFDFHQLWAEPRINSECIFSRLRYNQWLLLLAIGLLGFWIIKRNIIPENVLRFLAVLAIEIALPCMVFVNIIIQFSPSSLSDGGNIRYGGWYFRLLPSY